MVLGFSGRCAGHCARLLPDALEMVGIGGTFGGSVMDVRGAERWRYVALLVTSMALVATAVQGYWALAAEPAKDALGSTRCARPLAVAERFETDASALESTGEITFGGRQVPLTSPQEFLAGPPRGVAWDLWFHSWSWLAEIARAVHPSTAVDHAVAWHEANPDVGGAAPRHEQRMRGWTEGAVTQRMTTVTCLWSVTRDERLLPVMRALAEANLDETRYYGRPHFAPHNRGAMANLALIAAGEEFDEPQWVSAALGRLSVDFPEVFAECGMDREQSASYFKHNHRLWLRAAAIVGQQGDDSLVSLMGQRLDAAGTALRALTAPTGSLAAIGDGSPVPGLPPNPDEDSHWWCPERGWAAGRDSWRDPSMHYTARFGPAMSAHGHDDHGSLTWWVGIDGGVSVLVDRGNPPKDRDPTRRLWARSKAAHNTFAPKGLDYRTSSSGSRQVSDDTVGLAVIDVSLYRGVGRERHAIFSLKTPELEVTDSGSATHPVTWVQAWHLAPDWRVTHVSGGIATAVHARGSVLTLTCTAMSDQRSTHVRMRLLSVPHFDSRGAERAAAAVSCEARGSSVSIRTRLIVTPRPHV